MSSDVVIGSIVLHHWEEAASTYVSRRLLTQAPHVRLDDIRKFDDRMAAHLDGLAVAGNDAWEYFEGALVEPWAGCVFVAAVRAVDAKDGSRLERLLTLAAGLPEGRREFVAALGWLEQHQLQGVVANLLKSKDTFRREMGIAACAVHGVDPRDAAGTWLVDEAPIVRGRAALLAGELGGLHLLPACSALVADDDGDVRARAARASVLLGNRGTALESLVVAGSTPDPHRLKAFRLALQALPVLAAHNRLQDLARKPENLRWLVQGSGVVGDPRYVPWLIGHMSSDQTARLAGEAFTLITGADLESHAFVGKPPENYEGGPNNDPDDPNVEMDPDEGLPWPDSDPIRSWWSKNSDRFQAGERYFMGAPLTREHCIDVLKNGYQRQRILAAHYLCLLDPGTPLFNTSAPAWRQQKLLAELR